MKGTLNKQINITSYIIVEMKTYQPTQKITSVKNLLKRQYGSFRSIVQTQKRKQIATAERLRTADKCQNSPRKSKYLADRKGEFWTQNYI